MSEHTIEYYIKDELQIATITTEEAESLLRQLNALGFGVKQAVKTPDEPKKKHSCDDPKCAVCGHPWAE